MANIIPLKEESGAQFYPQTHEKAVIDSNGVNLQTKLANITTPSYVTAWDGVSTPVVANIPSGVVVTYNSTDYTGTLAASASTLNKTYLVATGTANNYYRYVTELSGSSYSWRSIGTTEINLSDYATKEELSQLSQEVDGETTFTRGQISTTTGNVDNTSTTRAYTPFLDNPGKVYFPTSVKVSPRYYDAQKVYHGYDEWITTGVATFDTTYPFVRIVVAYSNNATISDASAFNSIIQLRCIHTRVEENERRLADLEKVRQNTDFVIGQIDNTGEERNDNTRCRSVFFKTSDISTVSCSTGYKYSYRWYDAQKNYITTTLSWRTTATTVSDVAPLTAVYFRIVAANSDDSSISTVSAMDAVVFVYAPLSSELVRMENGMEANTTAIQALQQEKVFSSSSSVGNCSILAAKQHTFSDGTPPLYEWFLLADPDNNLYLSRNLATRTFLCAFADNVSDFAFGILPNGDIIACKMASALSSGGSDDNRVNPYVFKASESWAVKHEVNFGASLKPCGWLENCGFTTLPDGTAMFAEYTRVTVATCNCWKIVGDASDPTNWVVKKSFTLSGEPDSGFKHAHMVTVDFYTGVIYLATGDDNVGAMVFASTDGGDTWTQLREGSELYCRMLMMTFTEDYIYWAQDTPGQHYFYRGERDADGVLDYSTVTQFVTIPGNASNYFASYGQAYLPEYDAVLLLDRQDSGDSGQTLPIRAITLSDGQIHTVGTIEATDGGNIGFRTSFSEWYPVGGLIRVGFGFSGVTVNKNKVCGNKWPVNNGQDSVNNLWLKVSKDGSNWSLKIGTCYL